MTDKIKMPKTGEDVVDYFRKSRGHETDARIAAWLTVYAFCEQSGMRSLNGDGVDSGIETVCQFIKSRGEQKIQDSDLIIDGGLTAVVKSPLEIIGIECDHFSITIKGDISAYVSSMADIAGLRIALSQGRDGYDYYSPSNGGLWLRSWLKDFESTKTIDIARIPIDYPVEVSDDNNHWEKRHFSKICDGRVHCFHLGKTSWTNYSGSEIRWSYLRLPSFPDVVYKRP